VAGLVGHLNSVLDPRSIGCSPREPACRRQTAKTHFEEDVRFACDCDIALAICEFAGLRISHAEATQFRQGIRTVHPPDSRGGRVREFDRLVSEDAAESESNHVRVHRAGRYQDCPKSMLNILAQGITQG